MMRALGKIVMGFPFLKQSPLNADQPQRGGVLVLAVLAGIGAGLAPVYLLDLFDGELFHRFDGLVIFLVAICIIVVSPFIINRWRTPLVFLGFFLLINVEDLFRILLENNLLVFFIKYVFFSLMMLGYFLMILGYLKDRRNKLLNRKFKVPFRTPLVLFLFFALIQSFNPNLDHPLQPLVGGMAQFFFIFIFPLAYYYFDEETKIKQFLIFVFALVGLESLLAILQFIYGPSWWYSIVGKPETLVLFVNRNTGLGGPEFLRPSSVFVDAGRFYQYLSVVSTVAVGSFFFFEKQRQRFVHIGSFMLLVAAIFITSGRTTVYLFLFTTLMFFAKNLKKFVFKLLALTPLVVLLIWLFLPKFFVDELSVRFSLLFISTQFGLGAPGDQVNYRDILSLSNFSRAVGESGIIGHGLGSNSLGLHFIGLSYKGEEPGYAALIWEYGLLGPFLWLLMMGTLLYKSVRAYQLIKATKYGNLGLSILLLEGFAFIYQHIGFQIMQNYMVTIYFWTFAAMLFSLQGLAERSQISHSGGDRVSILSSHSELPKGSRP